jgi:polyvinyl alcohol dehydrogenase (cytochrome)
VIPGAVLAGGLDGVLRAYSTGTGEIIWSFDSSQKTHGINGLSGKGGTLDAAPVVVADGQLFFNSGYGGFFSVGSKAGNVFWVLATPK